MRLIYLSPVPWNSFAQRPHKFVEWFHQRSGEKILWLDPYPTRFPLLNDLWNLSTVETELLPKPKWLKIVSPKALPLEPLPGSYWLNACFWLSLVKKIQKFADGRQTLLVFGKPSALALFLLSRFEDWTSVYDAMDDFPAFYTGMARKTMMRHEKKLAEKVKVIWASSSTLKHHWSKIRSDVLLVPNGLDTSLLPAYKVPKRKSKQKIFGYVGTIASWFAWNWIIALAETRPNDLIRLIGPVLNKAPTRLPANIKLIPPCDHESALVAMRNFDIGLIPFKKNELTASVDPIKYYEYKALGLPVISTDFGEMSYRRKEAGTFISCGHADIPMLVKEALKYGRSSIEWRQYFVLENSWEARFDATQIMPVRIDN